MAGDRDVYDLPLAGRERHQDQAIDALIATGEWYGLAGFTHREWERLVFLRWLRRRGLLEGETWSLAGDSQ